MSVRQSLATLLVLSALPAAAAKRFVNGKIAFVSASAREAAGSSARAAGCPSERPWPSLSKEALWSIRGTATLTTRRSLLGVTRRSPVVVASLRNAPAVAEWLTAWNGPVAILAAGEHWPDGTTPFALEDWVGAGAVIANLTMRRSPEAEMAAAAFRTWSGDLVANTSVVPVVTASGWLDASSR